MVPAAYLLLVREQLSRNGTLQLIYKWFQQLPILR